MTNNNLTKKEKEDLIDINDDDIILALNDPLTFVSSQKGNLLYNYLKELYIQNNSIYLFDKNKYIENEKIKKLLENINASPKKIDIIRSNTNYYSSNNYRGEVKNLLFLNTDNQTLDIMNNYYNTNYSFVSDKIDESFYKWILKYSKEINKKDLQSLDVYGTKEYYNNLLKLLKGNYRGKINNYHYEILNDVSQENNPNYIEFIIEYPEFLNRTSHLLTKENVEKILEKNPEFLYKLSDENINKIDNQELINKISFKNVDFNQIKNPLFFTIDNFVKYIKQNSLKTYRSKNIYTNINNIIKNIPNFDKQVFLEKLFKQIKEETKVPEKELLLINTKLILSSKFFSGKIHNLKNLELYYESLNGSSLIEKNNEKIFFSKEGMEDFNFMFEMCKKNKNLILEEYVKPIYSYNKDFALYYLELLCTRHNTQKINLLKKLLPSQMVIFFESVGVNDNCLTFLKTYFEKKKIDEMILEKKRTKTVEIICKITEYDLFLDKINVTEVNKEINVEKAKKGFKL